MNGEVIAFFILAAMAIGGGVLMLISRKVMHMVLSLVLTFLSIAGIYFLLSAEFVGVVQIMVYAGAIAVMLIFGIMLTNHKEQAKRSAPLGRQIVLFLSILAFAAPMFIGISHLKPSTDEVALHENNTEKIGLAIYGDYLVPFEAVSVVLLVGLVGAVVLAKKEKEDEVSE